MAVLPVRISQHVQAQTAGYTGLFGIVNVLLGSGTKKGRLAPT